MAVEQLLVPELSSNQGVRAITQAVSAIAGVRLVVVNLADKSVRVEHDGRADLGAILKALADAGYQQVAVLT